MPSVLFQPTSISFGEAKAFVAEQYSKQTAPGMLTRAGRAIQRAVADWNKKHWEWNVVTAADITLTAGVTEYTLPYDFKDLYNAVLSVGGASYSLIGDSTRSAFRRNPDQIAGPAYSYSLLRRGSTGKLKLDTPPDQAGTIEQLNYYRRMIIPCAVSATGTWASGTTVVTLTTGSLSGAHLGNLWAGSGGGSDRYVSDLDVAGATLSLTSAPANTQATGTAFTVGGDGVLLDIPEDYVWAMLARACEHFLASVNASDKLILYWRAAAKEGLKEAMESLNNQADRDVCFIPAPGPTINYNMHYD